LQRFYLLLLVQITLNCASVTNMPCLPDPLYVVSPHRRTSDLQPSRQSNTVFHSSWTEVACLHNLIIMNGIQPNGREVVMRNEAFSKASVSPGHDVFLERRSRPGQSARWGVYIQQRRLAVMNFRKRKSSLIRAIQATYCVFLTSFATLDADSRRDDAADRRKLIDNALRQMLKWVGLMDQTTKLQFATPRP